ncbi:YSIRK-type signal peptide-containing protein [Lactobacillus helveticus]|nr:YSIRK-type signal peptide-containing protein [Lactobacillus helveticus]
MKPKKDRFSIRKFTVGAASVLIGFTFMGAVNSQEVKADTKPVSPEPSPAANEDKGEQKQSDAGAVQAEAETVDPNAHVETERVETQDNQAANVQTATDKENTLKVNSMLTLQLLLLRPLKKKRLRLLLIWIMNAHLTDYQC